MDKDRKKELQEEYRQMKTYMGIIQIRNTANGKRFLASTPNLKNQWLMWKKQLNAGRHMNPFLQEEWRAMGEDAFAYEILEKKAADEDDTPAVRRRKLKDMLQVWLDKLEPYGEKGYNRKK